MSYSLQGTHPNKSPNRGHSQLCSKFEANLGYGETLRKHLWWLWVSQLLSCVALGRSLSSMILAPELL